jgi:hypothetical protein
MVGWREAEQVVDEIARKFGDGMIRPATLVNDHREPPSAAI